MNFNRKAFCNSKRFVFNKITVSFKVKNERNLSGKNNSSRNQAQGETSRELSLPDIVDL